MGLEKKWLLYRRMYYALPKTHKTFLSLVLAQCTYIFIERLYVLITSGGDDMKSSIWYFLVIMVSVGFVMYFALHSVLHVNV